MRVSEKEMTKWGLKDKYVINTFYFQNHCLYSVLFLISGFVWTSLGKVIALVLEESMKFY